MMTVNVAAAAASHHHIRRNSRCRRNEDAFIAFIYSIFFLLLVVRFHII